MKPLCPLCKTRPVGDKESHIIPKMFRNTMGGKSPIKIYAVTPAERKHSKKSKQDITKQRGLLCDICETNLAVLESYYARTIYKKLHDPKYAADFKIKSGPFRTTKTLTGVDLHLINLLYQSILWRQHISSASEFEYFKLHPTLAEKIRKQLKAIISSTQQTMMQKMESNRSTFMYMPFRMWTHSKTTQGDNFLGAIPAYKNKYLLILNNVRVVLTRKLSKIKMYPTDFTTKTSIDLRIEYKKKGKWTKESEEIVMRILSYMDKL